MQMLRNVFGAWACSRSRTIALCAASCCPTWQSEASSKAAIWRSMFVSERKHRCRSWRKRSLPPRPMIIAASDWALHAARAATTTIPIVASPIGTDPVRAGVAESWARPGGNVTGVCLIAPELEVKRLSLLREALPSVRRIAVLSNHRKVVEAGILPLRKAAAEAGLELVEIWVESPNEYAAAFDAMRAASVEALVIVPT